MEQLRLEISRYTAPHRWYWALSDGDGALIADHDVELDPTCPEFAAFTRLDRYLRLNVSPQTPLHAEAEIVKWVGRWIGATAFGPIGTAMVARAPVTVAVAFPQQARALMFRPWELAVVDGLPLAVQDVSLVTTPASEAPPRRPKDPIAANLRMLAAFSLPDVAPSLILREQRKALVAIVDGLRVRHGKAIDLSVLQYDVSRDRLRDALEDGTGWDIVHFSGHGLAGGLVLDGPPGGQDVVPAAELIGLLRPGRARLKLLVLSSCNSAALPWNLDGSELPALAEQAACELDCGVLAMRYAVDDDFSIALADHLYPLLLGSGQPLTRALQLALPKALGDHPRPGVPPLSVGIPALFGRWCADLRLSAPAAPFVPAPPTMAFFPNEPRFLVGRTDLMSMATRMLGDEGRAGIMFTGAAGLGKTTCAVELAYRHQHSFGALAYYHVPAGGVIGSLRSFARALDEQVPGMATAGEVATAARLAVLTELAERNAMLIVIDGVEELLTADGYWRDPSWERVITALLDHRGFSRLVLTGRRAPRRVPDGLFVAEVEPLSQRESVLLARQLPVLGSLIRGTSEMPIATARRVLASVLTAAEGNPAAILASDEAPSADAAPDPEYVELVERWTREVEPW